MLVILRKLLYDFRKAKGKLLLLILAASLSAWGISSVFYGYQLAERDFQVNFARTFPADMSIMIQRFQPEIIEKILADDQVEAIERREVLGGSVKNEQGAWMPFVVYGVDKMEDMQMDVFRVVEHSSNEKASILIEQNAQFFLDENQDSITVQFSNQENTKWPISGTSHDARLAPARMERMVIAHATSLDLLTPYLAPDQQRFLIKTTVSQDRAAIQLVGDRLKQLGKQMDSPIRIINIPEPGKHIHQNIVDGVSLLQQNMGGIIAIMGLVLLSLILLTWLLPQVSDIGIMKAIGASTKHLFHSYCLSFLGIVTIGLLIGLPLGYFTATKYNQFIAFIQNFEPVTALLPLWTHIAIGFICLLIPMAIAIAPLSNAAKTTVKQAINQTFYTSFTELLKRIQSLFPNSQWRYSFNNLFRNSQRTILLMVLNGVGLGLFFTGVNLEYSVDKSLLEFAESAQYNVRVRFSEKLSVASLNFLTQLPFVKSISPMMDKSVSYQAPNKAYTETKRVRLLSPNHKLGDDFLIKGKLDKHCADCLYISGEGMRQEFENVDIGTRIPLTFTTGDTKNYRYSGQLKDMAAIGAPFFLFDTTNNDSLSAIAMETEVGYSAIEINNQLDDALLEKGIDMAGLLNVQMRLAQLKGHLAPTYLIIKATGIFTILMGLLGLLLVLNLTILERTRELGVMKALGCAFPKISNLLQLEFFGIQSISLLLGVLIAMPLTKTFCNILTETVIYHPIAFKNNYALMVLITLLVVVVQIVFIYVYNYFKLQQQARGLMD